MELAHAVTARKVAGSSPVGDVTCIRVAHQEEHLSPKEKVAGPNPVTDRSRDDCNVDITR